MKRSQINQVLRASEETLRNFRWSLPVWANWSAQDHRANPDQSAWLRAARWAGMSPIMAAAISRAAVSRCFACATEFSPRMSAPMPKSCSSSGVDQETPFHAHKSKLEDIIVRGGGTLCVEFTKEGAVLDCGDTMVRIDGGRGPRSTGFTASPLARASRSRADPAPVLGREGPRVCRRSQRMQR